MALASEGSCGYESKAPSLPSALAFLEGHAVEAEQDLLELAALPSISSMPEYHTYVLDAGKWLVKRLRRAGMKRAQLLKTAGLPVVYAEWLLAGKEAPTVLIYGHYDVQPYYVSYADAWTYQAFDIRLENGLFHGRGVTDPKGNILMVIHALESWIANGGLPVNVKVLLEAEEETGSASLPGLVKKKKALLSADLAVSCDSGQVSEDQGGIPISMRGRVSFDLDAQTLDHDVHSGFLGGSAQNALHSLVDMLASMRAPDGTVLVEGFYKGVQEMTDDTLRDLEDFPFDEEEENEHLGKPTDAPLEGTQSLVKRWLQPTLEIVGMQGGHTDNGTRGVVISKAFAKIMCRLVPDQNASVVLESMQQHVASHAPPHTNFTLTAVASHGRLLTEPYFIPKDAPGNIAAAKVLEELHEQPVLWYREGHSVSVCHLFEEYLGLKTTLFGFGSPDHAAQAMDGGSFRNDEKLSRDTYHKGAKAWVMLLQELAHGAQPAACSPTEPDLESDPGPSEGYSDL
ncbi:g11150 [Coccomyxa viridis]|uniref:G11150 protein n=1 Tax=Coccomyxa viridis TaxID=1274662 RepID=A0ABP1G8F7_9CHLO